LRENRRDSFIQETSDRIDATCEQMLVSINATLLRCNCADQRDIKSDTR